MKSAAAPRTSAFRVAALPAGAFCAAAFPAADGSASPVGRAPAAASSAGLEIRARFGAEARRVCERSTTNVDNIRCQVYYRTTTMRVHW